MFKSLSPSTRITIFVTLFPLISLLFYGLTSNILFVNAQQKIIEQDFNKNKKYIMDIEKQYLKEKIESLSLLITLNAENQLNHEKKTIKEFINNTAEIANNLFNENKNRMSQALLQDVIINALKNTNFGHNVDYLYLLDLKGNVFLHRDESIVNTNSLDIQDITGKYIVRNFIKIVTTKQEGYSRYYWYKGSGKNKIIYPKISYVKKLEAYDWFIGAGIPTYEISLNSGNLILNYIQTNDRYKNVRFYISDSANNIIFTHNQSSKSNLLKYRIEGFYKDELKMAYTRYLPEHDWYITVLKDLNGMQQSIAQSKNESVKIINEKIGTNIFLVLASWFISILLSLYLSRLIYKRLKVYQNTIDKANKKLVFQSRQAAIGELLPMIAHQWRQPINKIGSILILIRFSLSDNKVDLKKIDQQCRNIEENIEFMSQTIEDFRSFYQPGKKRQQEDLKLLIDKSISFLEPQIRNKGINIIAPEKSMHCVLYANEFMQVIINLIGNSIEAIEGLNGEICIGLFKGSDNIIVVSVEDNGKGITEHDMQRVFDPYFSTKKGSMGLGLYMCKMITEKHLHGSISVKNLSQGTRIEIVLGKINKRENV